jgi:hypothetical protein
MHTCYDQNQVHVRCYHAIYVCSIYYGMPTNRSLLLRSIKGAGDIIQLSYTKLIDIILDRREYKIFLILLVHVLNTWSSNGQEILTGMIKARIKWILIRAACSDCRGIFIVALELFETQTMQLHSGQKITMGTQVITKPSDGCNSWNHFSYSGDSDHPLCVPKENQRFLWAVHNIVWHRLMPSDRKSGSTCWFGS